MEQSIHRGLTGSDTFLRQWFGDVPMNERMLVTGQASYAASGAKAGLSQWFNHESIHWSGFPVNPQREEVVKGLERYRARSIRRLVAVGGGSVIDMAKLFNHFRKKTAKSNAIPPLLAIPTTSGSGSEATHFAVCYQGPVKTSIADPSLRPDSALLIPEWTYSMTPYQTACSGIDALAQGIESHWAKGATAASRQHSARAITLALAHLEEAVLTPSPVHRAGMQEAAYAAGCAIDTAKTTAAHAYSYALTMQFGLPHGHAVALLLPFFIDAHQRVGIQVPGVEGHEIRQLIQRIGLKSTVPAPANDVFTLLREQVNQERLANNPVPVADAWLVEIADTLTQ